MVNKGIAPPNASTSVGRFRFISGDYEYTALTPPEVGFGNYTIWSDNVISSFLEQASGSVSRAISLGYLQAAAAVDAQSIKTDDLSYSGKSEVDKWLALAKFWGDRADAEDGALMNDWFDLVPVGGFCDYGRAEASPWPSRSCW